METLKALEFVMGIYALGLAVTFFVWLVIIAIRWISRERARPAHTGSAPKRAGGNLL
ncbi:MAG TPA: hypothetical protein VE131_03850 [Terriglobales bacterium]|nr:hypothetical protein [Terriglobales bacterium]